MAKVIELGEGAQRYVIGYICNTTADAMFLQSLSNLMLIDKTMNGSSRRGWVGTIGRECGVGLCAGRNRLAIEFVNARERHGADWLLMLDTDMTFPPDLFARLVRHADSNTVAAGLYFGFNRDDRKCRPLMYTPERKLIMDWERGSVVDAYAAGTGCMLIHWRVFESVEFPWFRQAEDGSYLEDEGFCRHFQKFGVKLKVDTGLGLGHAKGLIASEEDYWAIRGEQDAAREKG